MAWHGIPVPRMPVMIWGIIISGKSYSSWTSMNPGIWVEMDGMTGCPTKEMDVIPLVNIQKAIENGQHGDRNSGFSHE